MSPARVICLANAFRPRHHNAAVVYDMIVVLAGSLVIAASAQISIHVAFTPVPITGQTFAVLLVAALLGSHRGGAAVLAYLAQGMAGLPVFAGGAAGPMVFTTPSGGYLVGFLAGALVVGYLAEHGWSRSITTAAIMFVLGEAMILGCGTLWLASYHGVAGAVTLGVLPFVPGAMVKITLATLMLPLGWKALAAFERRMRE